VQLVKLSKFIEMLVIVQAEGIIIKMSWLHKYLILFSDGSVAPGNLYIGRGESHIMCMWDYSMTSRLDPCCNIFTCLYIQMILAIYCTHNYFLYPYLLTVILRESILACTDSKYLEYLFIWPWLRNIWNICLFGHGY
jgi:hypothetical protein